MANDASDVDKLKAEIHWALQTAIESPAERAEAIGAVVEQMRELCMRDAHDLIVGELQRNGLLKE